MANLNSYVCKCTEEQINKLKSILEVKGWKFSDLNYAYWKAQLDKTTIAAYNSGKVTVQGKGTAEIVQFTIEPELLGEARFGYEEELIEQDNPEMFEPHAGIDESGKGDYFGPLVIAAAYTNRETARTLIKAGITDSKKIGSDKKIASLAEIIKNEIKDKYAIVSIGPESYNRLYSNFGNLNKLLAWGHARSLENILEKAPDCPWALSDQFGNKATVQRALMTKGQEITLKQRTKAESDIAVAAASILARDEFVRRLDLLGKKAGITLPKGANAKVVEAAQYIVETHGQDSLNGFAKMHFKTTEKIIN